MLWPAGHNVLAQQAKIKGVNLVAPPDSIGPDAYAKLKDINAGWVALNPYAYCEPGQPNVFYDDKRQWWGECSAGVRTMVSYARQYHLKVMIKPHIWVTHKSWAGDFDLETDAQWRAWESAYEQYILHYAHMAENMGAELFCMGTEIRNAVEKRPAFWKHLIRELRSIYHGKLTYAANWDSYMKAPFWNELDYLGVDAYFPLSEEKLPSVEILQSAWKPHLNKLKSFADSLSKPVIFTEYGYRSIEQNAWKQWELPEHWESDGQASYTAQVNAYGALYLSVWKQPWFAGGFLWKWYPGFTEPHIDKTDYTPQGKPVMKLIRRVYETPGK